MTSQTSLRYFFVLAKTNLRITSEKLLPNSAIGKFHCFIDEKNLTVDPNVATFAMEKVVNK